MSLSDLKRKSKVADQHFGHLSAAQRSPFVSIHIRHKSLEKRCDHADIAMIAADELSSLLEQVYLLRSPVLGTPICDRQPRHLLKIPSIAGDDGGV